ncbi:MAG: DEAD/DEAH box helicase [Muribaculaceae bacterium]|nr:DEAD/DEAH box helicase [Muribaculaceae bacterium]
MTFDQFDLNDEVLDALDAMRFSECTPIQEQAIPLALEGRDLIAVAQTGTGKTAAYLLPVINRLADGGFADDAVNAIVMAPTRELAMQIDRQLEGFAYFLNISSLPIYGGTDGATFAQQQRGLKMGADVVISTPGRLLAHLDMGYVDLSRVSFFILDEADRMLDMGFYDDIMQIVRRLPKERQTMLFSATMPPKIQQLAADILTDPAEIKLAVSRPADRIRQRVAFCGEDRKMALLRKVLSGPEASRVIVFASSKLKVKQLARELRGAGRKIGEMHSDLEQSRREEVMLDFKSGRIGVLVATDIVARGIDIDDISMVINYDVPHDAEDYVHRIGRTARAEADGAALTMVGERDRRRWTGIERFLGKPVERLEGFEGTKKHTDTDAGKGKTGRSNAKPAQNRAPKKKRAAADTHVEKPQTDTPAEKLEADSIAVETTKSRKKRSQPWWRRRKKGTAKAENANPENVKTDNI